MPFLQNAWYVAAWSSELGDDPIGRYFLDQPVVMYRDSARRPVALTDRCPHRFAPLHLGRVQGDRIACGYHGLVFSSDGRCVHNPHGDNTIPAKADLRSYPVVERDGVIWIWMGNPASADPSQIIDTHFMVDPGFAPVAGYLHVKANYQLIIDNLLDLTHPAYLHRDGISTEEYQGEKMEHRFRQVGTTIHSDYDFRGVPPGPALKPFWPADKTDVRAHMRLAAPSALSLDFRMSDVGGDPETGVMLPSLHLLVPETMSSTHYFYAICRNVLLGNAEVDAAVRELTSRAFAQEDEPMIRACQDMMGTTNLFELQPVLLKTDVAAVRARLLLDRLIGRETPNDVDLRTADAASSFVDG